MKNALEEEGGKERMREIKSRPAREAERAGLRDRLLFKGFSRR